MSVISFFLLSLSLFLSTLLLTYARVKEDDECDDGEPVMDRPNGDVGCFAIKPDDLEPTGNIDGRINLMSWRKV